jgi:hypothetical protein
MARAPALQAGGQGFDSLILHQEFKISLVKQKIDYASVAQLARVRDS